MNLWPLWFLLTAIFLPELVLMLADAGLVGSAGWRSQAYQYGGFWAGLLRDWQPNYAAQPVMMFFSYAFLHSGPSHLAGNMITLVWLGTILLAEMGAARFLAIYAAATLGGAALFGILSAAAVPMIGASGALFGLTGAWMVQDWRRNTQPIAGGGIGRRAAARAALRIGMLLVVLNIAVWVLQSGLLAWQTHLGGFLTGALLTAATGRSGPGSAEPGAPGKVLGSHPGKQTLVSGPKHRR